MRALVASVVLSLLVLAGCGDDDAPVATGGGGDPTTTAESTSPPVGGEQARLDAARQRWQETGIEDYRITWTLRCFCPTTAFIDTVEEGQVVDHREAPTSEAIHDPGPKTMASIFDEVQAAIDLEPASLEVDYDDETGAVRSYWVDEDEMIVDEEHGIEVDLQPLVDGEVPGLPEVVLSDLTEAHGCGYGFQVGRPDGSVGLFLERSEPATSGSVVLPADGWTAEVRLGDDLFANWCDDVLEPDEPTPVVAERWEVVEGALDVSVPADGQQGMATVVATGLVAERPDGERVPLGDITVENPFYGTFAG